MQRKKRKKFGNIEVEKNGTVFASKREYRRYLYLKMLEERGQITELRQQVPYLLIESQWLPNGQFYKRGPKKGQPKLYCAEKECSYVADFVYKDSDGNTVVEDAKGVLTKEYRIKRKLMLKVHGIKIQEV